MEIMPGNMSINVSKSIQGGSLNYLVAKDLLYREPWTEFHIQCTALPEIRLMYVVVIERDGMCL